MTAMSAKKHCGPSAETQPGKGIAGEQVKEYASEGEDRDDDRILEPDGEV